MNQALSKLPGRFIAALALTAALSACAGTAPAHAPGAMREIGSLELAREMSPGVNLGNTLEAIPAETSRGRASGLVWPVLVGPGAP